MGTPNKSTHRLAVRGVIAPMNKHVVVVHREVIERRVGVDPEDRLDVVVGRVRDVVAVVRIPFAHNEPDDALRVHKLFLEPREVRWGLRQRRVDVVKIIVLKTQGVQGTLNVRVQNLVAVLVVAVPATGARRLADCGGGYLGCGRKVERRWPTSAKRLRAVREKGAKKMVRVPRSWLTHVPSERAMV